MKVKGIFCIIRIKKDIKRGWRVIACIYFHVNWSFLIIYSFFHRMERGNSSTNRNYVIGYLASKSERGEVRRRINIVASLVLTDR